MGCGNCPEPTTPTRSARLQAKLDQVPAEAPVADPYEVLPAGTTILPAGEPDLILRVAVDRLRAGLPPILILAGMQHGTTYAASEVRLLGPSTLARVARSDFSIALRTRAAVEVI